MKTVEQIKDARYKLCERLKTEGLNDLQKTLIAGMLNALIWTVDGVNSSTMDRMLSDEPMAAGKDPEPVLKKMNERMSEIILREQSKG